MAESEVKIKVKAEGTKKAKEEVAGIGAEFKKLLAPIRAVRTAIGGLFSVMGTVGFVINGWNAWIDTVKSFRDWLEKAKREAFQLMRAGQDAAFAEGLAKTANSAKYLADNLKTALDRIKAMGQFQDAWNAGQRGVEAARSNLEESRELAGVTDPDRRAEISERYAVRRAEVAWRDASVDADTKRGNMDSQIKAARDAIFMERKHQERATGRLEDVRFWMNDGRLSKEELENRIKLGEALEREIAASKRREREANELIVSLERQKRLLGSGVDAARLGYEKAVQDAENGRRSRAAEAAREFQELTEKSARKLEKARAEGRIEEAEEELKGVEDAMGSAPQVLKDQGRISAMGGFATAGGAAMAGFAAGGDRTYGELRQHRDLLRREIEELRKIVKNTEDGGATFG